MQMEQKRLRATNRRHGLTRSRWRFSAPACNMLLYKQWADDCLAPESTPSVESNKPLDRSRSHGPDESTTGRLIHPEEHQPRCMKQEAWSLTLTVASGRATARNLERDLPSGKGPTAKSSTSCFMLPRRVSCSCPAPSSSKYSTSPPARAITT